MLTVLVLFLVARGHRTHKFERKSNTQSVSYYGQPRGDALSGLWPLPTGPMSCSGAGSVLLHLKETNFTIVGENNATKSSALLQAAFRRYTQIIFASSPPTLCAARDHFRDVSVESLTSLSVSVTGITSQDGAPTLETNEAYTLNVSAPIARLTALSVVGALRGLETFSQLVVHVDPTIIRHTPGVSDEDDMAVVINGSAVTIKDRPRFPWRGETVKSISLFSCTRSSRGAGRRVAESSRSAKALTPLTHPRTLLNIHTHTRAQTQTHAQKHAPRHIHSYTTILHV